MVNSIHAIAERDVDPDKGKITVEVLSFRRLRLLSTSANRSEAHLLLGPILGFKVIDNGIGFNDANMASFETLDTEYEESQGCRGRTTSLAESIRACPD